MRMSSAYHGEEWGGALLRFIEVYTCKTGPLNESGDNNYLKFVDNLSDGARCAGSARRNYSSAQRPICKLAS